MDHKLRLVFGAAGMFLGGLLLSAQASGQALPDDKGKAEFVHNCTACHRADMVVAVKKTPDEWRKSVDEMAARGTDGTKEDLDNVVLYLDKYFSTETPSPADVQHPSTGGKPDVPKTLGFSSRQHTYVLDVSYCFTCRRAPASERASQAGMNDLVRYLVSRPVLKAANN